MSENTITELRSALFDTLRDLKDGKMDLDRAKAINETAQTIINSAKVEVDHMKIAGGGSKFLSGAAGEGNAPPLLPGQTRTTKTASGTTSVTALQDGKTVTRHTMNG